MPSAITASPAPRGTSICWSLGSDAEAAILRAQRATVGDLEIPVLALDDLIANKRAAGRPQDLADATLLERVRDRRP